MRRWNWKWWHKAGLGGMLVLAILIAGSVSFRERWIEPMPGVRTEMTRPFVKEQDLPLNSAFMLLVEALETPAGALPSQAPWSGDWSDAVTKFRTHPWPREQLPFFVPTKGYADPAVAADAPWIRSQCEEIERLVKLYEPNMALLDRALAAPDPRVPTLDSPNFTVSYLPSVMKMPKWLAVQAQYKGAIGDHDGAAKDIERALGMADIITRGGFFFAHLLAANSDALTTETTWTMATREQLPAPVLRRLALGFLRHADGVEPFVEAVRNEALASKKMAELAYRKESGMFTSLSGREQKVWEFATSCGFLAGSTVSATRRNLLSYHQHLVAIAEKPYSPAVEAAYDDFFSKLLAGGPAYLRTALRVRDPVGFLVVRMTAQPVALGHRDVTVRIAALRAMAVFCAIKAYEKEQGQTPDQLEDLVPEYLPRVPTDPFGDGAPLHYLRQNVPRLPPDAWGVYSNGVDFTDSGGMARTVGSPGMRRKHGPDLVWPSRDYPAKTAVP